MKAELQTLGSEHPAIGYAHELPAILTCSAFVCCADEARKLSVEPRDIFVKWRVPDVRKYQIAGTGLSRRPGPRQSELCNYFKLSGTTPPVCISFDITCLCSQRFISAEPSSAPVYPSSWASCLRAARLESRLRSFIRS